MCLISMHGRMSQINGENVCQTAYATIHLPVQLFRLYSKVRAHLCLLILSWNVDNNISISYGLGIEEPRHQATCESLLLFLF